MSIFGVQTLPMTREEEHLSEILSKDRNEPCWLCKREKRKTLYGYMCWECQEARHIWEAELLEINRAEYERKRKAHNGLCVSCASVKVSGDFECAPCRAEWEK